MSAPDFKDREYEPEKSPRRTASDDAESCVEFCCRLPLTTCAIVGLLVVGIGYLITNQDVFLNLVGVLIIVALTAGFYYRYSKN